MMAEEPFEELRRVLDTRVRSESPTAACVDDDTIAALAAGTLSSEQRAGVLPHVASCARCHALLASVARALADDGVAREVRAIDNAGWRRVSRIVLPLAAAAVLLLLVWPRGLDDGGPGHRGPAIIVATAPVPISPVGAVAEAARLQWAAVPGADRYRVTLFDAGGGVLYETQLPDTVAALPDSIALAPGRPYLWKVEARTGVDRWAGSDLVEFSIAGGPPR